jgi:CRISPR/Cas system endoribonuclease Cas6 (RAMP superfamily)
MPEKENKLKKKNLDAKLTENPSIKMYTFVVFCEDEKVLPFTILINKVKGWDFVALTFGDGRL